MPTEVDTPTNPEEKRFVVERVTSKRRRRLKLSLPHLLMLAGAPIILAAVGLVIASNPADTASNVAAAPLPDNPQGLTPTASIPPDFATQLAAVPAVTNTSPPPTSTSTPTTEPTLALPDEYVLQLSATPAPVIITPTPIPANIIQPTFTPAFVAATPQLDLTNSLIVFVCREDGGDDDEICTINADGSDLRQLTFNDVTDWYPSFSYDGQEIVYSTQRNGQFDIHIMDLDGLNDRQITSGLDENYAPALSPDGGQIVFTSTFGPGPEQNVWLVNSDGSNPRQLTFSDFDDIDPIWSPDGTQIAFASNRNGTTELFVMYPDGSNVRQITSGMNIGGRNDWSHDGQYMTFYAGPKADKDIWLIRADCAYTQLGCIAEPIQLTDGGHNKGPSFSPDSKWVVYASQADENQDNEVFLVSIDGMELVQLTRNVVPDWQPRWSP